jgi:RNA polymerase sigma-70 factor (ECF subfamily)
VQVLQLKAIPYEWHLERQAMADRELIRGLKSGRPEAFKKLVEEYQNKVINTCNGFLQNEQDAEDIAQEVFIEVHKSIAGFREEARLSTWIYRISVSRSLDFIRKQKRKKRIGRIRNMLRGGGGAKQVPSEVGSRPDTILENRERFRILRQAIDSLAENQKVAITLSKCEGLGNKEIAEIMGTTLSSVEALIHRAKRNLRKKLGRYYERHL